MNKLMLALFVAGITVNTGMAQASGDEIRDDKIGLSRTSVFDDPSPESFAYSDRSPGSGNVLPRAYRNAPPQIPHSIEDFVPITANSNMCISCHDLPNQIGKKDKGAPTAMPTSHYNDADGKLVKSNGRHFCTYCHVPQAGVGELVGNTFKPD